MKKQYLHLVVFGVFALLLSSCGVASNDDIAPQSLQKNPYYEQNEALAKALKGSWNTELVKENGILVYSKSNQNLSTVDYGNFKITLNENATFTMKDKYDTLVEGVWYVTFGNTLNIDFEKKGCSVASATENNCNGKVIVTASFNIEKAPKSGELVIENDNVDYLMKSNLQ